MHKDITMNIQERKLGLIEEFLKITNENTITKIETLLRQEKQSSYRSNLQPMSLSEFHEMIDRAKKDSLEGRTISHQDLKKKVKTWK